MVGHREIVDAAGYTLTQDNVGKHIDALARLIKPRDGMVNLVQRFDFVRTDYMLRMFMNAQVRKGNAYTYKQWRVIAQPDRESLRFIQIFEMLVKRQLLKRGYALDCDNCGLITWVPLEHLQEDLRCSGCFREYPLPLEFDLAYRLNPLLLEAIKNGALTVILMALCLWDEVQNANFDWEAGLQFERGKFAADVDLLVKTPDLMYLVEAKDTIRDVATVQTQLKKLQMIENVLRKEMPVVVCFATLAESIPPEITAFCAENNIRVLTRSELIRADA